MSTESRNKRANAGNRKPRQQAQKRKSPRNSKTGKTKTHKKVPGIKPTKKETDEEKKLLNKRPRIKIGENEKSPKPLIRANGEKMVRTYKKNNRRLDKRRERPTSYTETMRLNRYISNAGICSRREADKYIESGLVTVNGKTVSELGVKVSSSDDIRLEGKRLSPEKKMYLVLNKPRNFIATTEDPNAEKTVMDLIKNACPERIYPVGRLDRNTTGILLFTNDGDLSKRLTHPSHNVKKIYQVTLDKPVTKQHIIQIAEGIELEDGHIAADAISYIDPGRKEEIGIEIHSGRNHIVRRIFEHLGYRVKKLDRTSFAGITKKNLPRGKWRFLSPKEVNFLKMK